MLVTATRALDRKRVQVNPQMIMRMETVKRKAKLYTLITWADGKRVSYLEPEHHFKISGESHDRR